MFSSFFNTGLLSGNSRSTFSTNHKDIGTLYLIFLAITFLILFLAKRIEFAASVTLVLQGTFYYKAFFFIVISILVISLVLFASRFLCPIAFFNRILLLAYFLVFYIIFFDFSQEAIFFTFGEDHRALNCILSDFRDSNILTFIEEEQNLSSNILLWIIRRCIDTIIIGNCLLLINTQIKEGKTKTIIGNIGEGLIGNGIIYGQGEMYKMLKEYIKEKVKKTKENWEITKALLRKENLMIKPNPLLVSLGGGTGAGYYMPQKSNTVLVNSWDASGLLNYQDLRKKYYNKTQEDCWIILEKEKPMIFNHSSYVLNQIDNIKTQKILPLKQKLLNKKYTELFPTNTDVENAPIFKGDSIVYEGPIHPRQLHNIHFLFKRYYLKINEMKQLSILQGKDPKKQCVMLNNNKQHQMLRVDGTRYGQYDYHNFVDPHFKRIGQPYDRHEADKEFPNIKKEGIDLTKIYNNRDYEIYVKLVVNNDKQGKIDLFKIMINKMFTLENKLSPKNVQTFFDQQGATHLVIAQIFHFANEEDQLLYLSIFEDVLKTNMVLYKSNLSRDQINLETFSDIKDQENTNYIEAGSFKQDKDFRNEITKETTKKLTNVDTLNNLIENINHFF